ncbi:MAG: aminotransferase class I/II-fold pyridoxal phosphate-dependent enzyme [Planctomycetes bacterium]|nr:aminotransferase class I/II-fold pyridoxal phosphate-dependent enzyme [Planctomycetota bacterium]
MNVHESDEAICARGGWAPDFKTRPSAPPIYQTTAFDMHGLEQLDSVAAGVEPGYIYTRDGNPNHEAFARDVARLEGAEAGVVCASGMGAMTATLLAHVRSGDHVVAARVLYGRTVQLLNHLKSAFGVDVTFVDANHPAEFARALTPQTKLAIVETISNPLMEVADLPAIVSALGSVPLLVDSTFATPCLLRPIEQGAKLVFHSASKYLNGHGDVMLGVVVGPRDIIRKIKGLASLYGVNSNPLECWLASRGLRTLPLRMERVSQTAAHIAEFLTRQPAVARVYYPGLANHPSHPQARQYLSHGFGGMLAFELHGGRPAVATFFRELAEQIPFSPTLADARSTLSYPTGTSHKFMTADERRSYGIGDGLVRLSIGLEAPADLERELSAALAKLSGTSGS